MDPIRRSPPERLAAWIVTGPAGHLWSVVADIVVRWPRYALSRSRGRPRMDE